MSTPRKPDPETEAKVATATSMVAGKGVTAETKKAIELVKSYVDKQIGAVLEAVNQLRKDIKKEAAPTIKNDNKSSGPRPK